MVFLPLGDTRRELRRSRPGRGFFELWRLFRAIFGRSGAGSFNLKLNLRSSAPVAVLLLFALLPQVEGKALTRYYVGKSGLSCDDVCSLNVGIGTCDVTRINALSSEENVNNAVSAITADQGIDALSPGNLKNRVEGCFANGCPTHSVYTGASDPNGQAWYPALSGCARCTRNPTLISSCAAKYDGLSRLCCCPAAGEDASTVCAMSASDCTPGMEWDADNALCRGAQFVCPAGQWKDSVQATCVLCAVGKYGSASGQTSEAAACTGTAASCPVGTFGASLNVAGRSACAECHVGGRNTPAGSMKCEALTRWYAAPNPGVDCNVVCTATAFGGPCDQNRLVAVSTSAKLETVVLALAADQNYEWPENPWRCASFPGGVNNIPTGLYTSNQNCFMGGTLSCDVAFSTIKRLCCCPLASDDAASVCPVSSADCASGMEWDAGTGTCRPANFVCAAGQWKDSSGATPTCVMCSIGKYGSASGQLSEAAACTGSSATCSNGTFGGSLSKAGMSACARCPIDGQLTPAGSMSCILGCHPGSYNAAPAYFDASILMCTECTAGSWSVRSGLTSQSQCTRCSAGKHGASLSGRTSDAHCVDCAAGRYAPGEGSSSKCEEMCPIGRFSNATGQRSFTTCRSCAPSFVATQGASACHNCTVNFAPTLDGGQCEANQPAFCPAGQHAVDYARCTNCSAGRFADSVGRRNECVQCGLGYVQSSEGQSECEECPPDTVSGIVYTSTECVSCGGGETRDTVRVFCSPCSAGSLKAYNSTAKRFECQPCGQGSVALSGSDACKTCDGDTVPDITNAVCVSAMAANDNCSAGEHVTGATSCVKCEAGSYSSTGQVAACTLCEFGKFTNSSGLSVCENCLPNYVSAVDTGLQAGAKYCTPCSEGWVPDGVQAACSICSAGKHKAFDTITKKYGCKVCPPGTVALGEKDACMTCDGDTVPDTTNAVCISAIAANDNCNAGEYVTGATRCAKCESGRYSTSGLSAACTFCELGKFANATGMSTCLQCIADYMSSIDRGAKHCTPCKSGAIPDAVQATCSTCPDATYKAKELNLSSSICRRCPKIGAACRGGTLEFDIDTWYNAEKNTILDDTLEMHTCFNDECCIQNEGRSRVECNEDKGYYGPLCGACDREKGAIRSGKGCQFCWEEWRSGLATAGIVGAWINLIGYNTVFEDFDAPAGDYTQSALKMLMSHLQMLGVLGIFKAKGTAVFNSVMVRPAEVIGGSVTSVLPLKCTLNSQAYGTFIANIVLPWLVPIIASVFLVPMVLLSRATVKKRKTKLIPTFKGRFGLPTVLAKWKILRVPMTAKDRARWHAPVDFLSRLVAVQIFMLFTLFPTLVASVASMLNCSDKIGGKYYLLADLSVACYEGWHIIYIAIAALAGIVYCIGIPLTVYFSVAFKSPIACRQTEVADEEEPTNRGRQRRRSLAELVTRCKPRFRLCRRRTSSDYASHSVRMRYGFLFNGYETNRPTDRSGIVVGWETVVMAQKLFVTLAGAVVRDAYFQILTALMVLMTAGFLQAYFQPYESDWLDLLHTISIFALLCTQILSIVYMYTDASEKPVIAKESLEILVTLCLFILNAVVVVVTATTWAFFALGIETSKLRCRKTVKMRLVTHEAEIAQYLAVRGVDDNGDDVTTIWRHPTKNTAQKEAPQQLFDSTGSPIDVWHWVDMDSGLATATTEAPQLLAKFSDDETVEAGDSVCVLDLKTLALSPLIEVPPDVGGATCCGAQQEDENENEEGIGAQAMPKAKGRPSLSNPMRRAELAMAAATTRTSGGATAIEMTSMLMEMNPLHRDAVSAGDDIRGEEDAAAAKKKVVEEAPRRSSRITAEQSATAFAGAFAGFDEEAPADIRPHSDGWYYTDANAASVLHGPSKLAALKDWLNNGHFQRSDLVRHGRGGKDVTLSTLVRVAEDGAHYTRTEFVEHFGGIDEWDAAQTQ